MRKRQDAKNSRKDAEDAKNTKLLSGRFSLYYKNLERKTIIITTVT